MSNVIYVSVEDINEPQWLSNVHPFLEEILQNRKHKNWELSVLFCSDTYMQQLNKQYREKDSSTDVLSFEQGEEYVDDDGTIMYTAGDIAISEAFLYENAKTFDVSPNEELKRLLVHGILHLEGYDHGDSHIGDDTTETNEMFEIQETLIKAFRDYIIIG